MQIADKGVHSSLIPLSLVCGCPGVVAHQALDPFKLWQALESESGCAHDVPFWAIVWPASAILAKYVLNGVIDVACCSVIEIGCGAAVAAIAAAKAGAATVIANDTDPHALAYATRNAQANCVNISTDNTDYIARKMVPDVDIILAADMFYQKKQAVNLAEMLLRARAQGCRVIIADAQRTFAPRSGVVEIASEVVTVNPDVEGTTQREVRVLELV